MLRPVPLTPRRTPTMNAPTLRRPLRAPLLSRETAITATLRNLRLPGRYLLDVGERSGRGYPLYALMREAPRADQADARVGTVPGLIVEALDAERRLLPRPDGGLALVPLPEEEDWAALVGGGGGRVPASARCR